MNEKKFKNDSATAVRNTGTFYTMLFIVLKLSGILKIGWIWVLFPSLFQLTVVISIVLIYARRKRQLDS